jgi:hypothetical protein
MAVNSQMSHIRLATATSEGKMEGEEIVPILKPCPLRGQATDRADRHVHRSMCRLRSKWAASSQHGACGSEVE